MGSGLIVGTALEAFGILAYAGLVFLVLRLATRWADRALDADASASDGRPAPDSTNGEVA